MADIDSGKAGTPGPSSPSRSDDQPQASGSGARTKEAEPQPVRGQTCARNRDGGSSSGQRRQKSKPFDAEKAFKELNSSMTKILPIVVELKQAYDRHNEAEDLLANSSSDSADEAQDDRQDVVVLPSPSVPGPSTSTEPLSYFEGLTGVKSKDGPAIHEKLSLGVTNVLADGLDSDIKETLAKKYLTPSNCPRLTLVSTNQTVYNANQGTKTADKGLQNVQRSLVPGLIAVTNGLDGLANIGDRKDIPDDVRDMLSSVTTSISDGMTLMANGSHLLDKQRRLLYKGHFKEEYSKSLCSDHYPIEKELFGADINEKIKGVSESIRVSNRIDKRQKRKFQPYTQKRNKFPFLGQSRNRDRKRQQWHGTKQKNKTHKSQ